MSRQRIEQQVIALAGVMQACFLVDQLAQRGQADNAAFNAMIHSLFAFEPESTEAVYGGLCHLQPGLGVLRDLLGGQRRPEYGQTLRYALGILQLQRQLAGREDLQAIIRSRLQHCERKLEHFSQDTNEIASSVAGVYQDTISTFRFRIQVTGSYQQLQDPRVADRIRALLLTAIRSAHLWRQLGGRRWHLLFRRGRLASIAATLADS